jgi:hypothetical protein
MKNLLISGNTADRTEWNVEEILQDKPKRSLKDEIDRMLQYEWDNTITKYGDGMTYLEREQFNNQYNNF